jgi:inosine/xanthosine triphosphatase
MQIVIATENNAKIQAVKKVFESVFGALEILAEKFPSEVAEQPLSETEGLQGALNRAKNARIKYPEADYCVGLEGYVDSGKFDMFLGGAVAIISKDGRIGLSPSAKVRLPRFMQEKIEAGAELGPLVKELMQDETGKIRQNEGTNGLLTNGLYTRIDEFADATKCALACFVSPELYEK